MKNPRAPRRTPRYDLLVEECRRLNRIADEAYDREAAERRKAEMDQAVRELREKYPPKSLK